MPICFTIYGDFECINVPKEETDDNDAKTIDLSRQEAISNGYYIVSHKKERRP